MWTLEITFKKKNKEKKRSNYHLQFSFIFNVAKIVPTKRRKLLKGLQRCKLSQEEFINSAEEAVLKTLFSPLNNCHCCSRAENGVKDEETCVVQTSTIRPVVSGLADSHLLDPRSRGMPCVFGS